MSSAALKEVATGKSTAQEAKDDYSNFKKRLDTLDGEFMPLLGGAQNVAKFKRIVLNAITATPDLLTADRRTLLTACMKAAQDGLLPDGREAVLNIYSTKVKRDGREEWIKAVQYLPMVHGMIKKLYESGQVTYVDAAAVYEKDRFKYRRGDDAAIEHEPYLGDDPGPIIAAYLVAKLKNGEVKREVMAKRDIDRVRAASKSANGPGWRDWEDQFAIKSVIKRGYKQLPNAPELERTIAADNAALGFSQFEAQTGMLDRQPGLPRADAPQLEHQPTQTIGTNIDELTERQEAELDQATGEIKTPAEATATPATKAGKAKGGPTAAEVEIMIANAKSPDQVDEARSLISGFPDDVSADLRRQADNRAAQLGTKDLL